MLHTAATGTSGASALMSFPSSSSSASPRWRAAGSLTKPHGTHTTNAVPRRPHEIERFVLSNLSRRSLNPSKTLSRSPPSPGPSRLSLNHESCTPSAVKLCAVPSTALHCMFPASPRQVNVVPRRGVSHVVMGAMNEDGITEGVTLVELEQQLSAAIAREDYSTAAALRDDIGCAQTSSEAMHTLSLPPFMDSPAGCEK